MAGGRADGQTDSTQEGQHSVAQVQPASAEVRHNGALVLSNPGASGIEESDHVNTKSHEGEKQEAEAPEESRESEEGSSGMCLRVKGSSLKP